MASSSRKTEYVVVPSWGARDAGKTFKITEWPARRAETWAWGMVFALKGTSGQIPDDVARMGMVGVAIRLMNTVLAADVDFAKVKPFYDELIDECVEIVRDPSNRDRTTGDYVATKFATDDDVQEVSTLQWLRSEVIRLHTNFSIIDSLWKLLADLRSSSSTSSTM